MDLPWDYQLRPGERGHPVVAAKDVTLPPQFVFPNDGVMARLFTGKGRQIKTWGRTPGKKEHDPHWIALKGGTTLHFDPAFPRYSHHLKIRVDDGVVVRGLEKREQPLYRGLFYILDAGSPHQIVCTGANKMAYNVAISVDSSLPLQVDDAVAWLLEYGQKAEFESF